MFDLKNAAINVMQDLKQCSLFKPAGVRLATLAAVVGVGNVSCVSTDMHGGGYGGGVSSAAIDLVVGGVLPGGGGVYGGGISTFPNDYGPPVNLRYPGSYRPPGYIRPPRLPPGGYRRPRNCNPWY